MKALGVLHASDFQSKEAACSMLITLIQMEGDRRNGKPENVETVIDGEKFVRDNRKIRRALHVELVRLGLPVEVLAALKACVPAAVDVKRLAVLSAQQERRAP